MDTALDEVRDAFQGLDDEALQRDFPDPVVGHHAGTNELLLHLLSHLSYHLGQIDYHRRMVTGANVTVEALPLKEVPGLRPVA